MSQTSPMVFHRFVALGDSQTEGLGDDPYPDGTERGWADHFAGMLAARNPQLLYANLAVRGRRIAEIHNQQLAPALALEPDLVSVIGGFNDVIRPRFDIDAALTHMHEMQRDLRATGATVLTTTFPDLSSSTPPARLVRTRLAAFNAGLREVAAENGTLLLDSDQFAFARDTRVWSEDRLHLNPDGHRRVALAMATLLAMSEDDQSPDDLLTPAPLLPLVQRLSAEARWARAFLLPWIGRRLTGRSSGDGRYAKRLQLSPYEQD